MFVDGGKRSVIEVNGVSNNIEGWVISKLFSEIWYGLKSVLSKIEDIWKALYPLKAKK